MFFYYLFNLKIIMYYKFQQLQWSYQTYERYVNINYLYKEKKLYIYIGIWNTEI